MSKKASKANFLPQHPVIIKKINQSSVQSTKLTLRKSELMSSSSKIQQNNDQTSLQIINEQKELVQKLKKQLKTLANKNNVMQQSLKYYDTEGRKKQILIEIQRAKQQQKQIQARIKNCQKVEQSTTPQEYYLWQKKKKMAEYDHKLRDIMSQNYNERQQLKQIREQIKQKISTTKQQIQFILHDIQLTQNQFTNDNITQYEGVDPKKMNTLKQQYQSVALTINMLKQNNQILYSQFQQGLSSMEISLKKSFQNSKSSLIRELQLIKRQVQGSQSSKKQRQREKQISPSQTIKQYMSKLKQIQDLLTTQQIQQAQKLIKPYDWQNFRWEQYLQNGQRQKQNKKDIDYAQKYKSLCAQYQKIDKQVIKIENQIQEAIKQNISMTQQSLQIQSATNKLMKLMGPSKK